LLDFINMEIRIFIFQHKEGWKFLKRSVRSVGHPVQKVLCIL
jgi:hypothetical protein